jgi:hypothetical protein
MHQHLVNMYTLENMLQHKGWNFCGYPIAEAQKWMLSKKKLVAYSLVIVSYLLWEIFVHAVYTLVFVQETICLLYQHRAKKTLAPFSVLPPIHNKSH